MKLSRHIPLVLGLVCGALVLSAPAEIVGFRGDGAGLYPKAKPVLQWSATSNVVWKTALTNRSNASPILVGDRIFVCAEPATLICVSADTGLILWQDSLTDLPQPAPPTHNVNGYTSATPCSDGRRVWVVLGQGMVACWEVSGKKLWAVTLERPPNGWGGCVSPRLAGDVLAVQFDHLFGLDPATGAERWKIKTPWGWGSPVVARIGKQDVLYTCKGAAIEAASGRELTKGLVALEYNSPCLVDGVLYYLQQKPQAYAVPEKPEDQPRPLWPGVAIAGDRYYATPLIHGGLVYAINQTHQLTVLDQTNGAVVYSKKVEFLQGTGYPSPTLAGGYVFLSSENGQTVVLKAGREYEEVARNSLETFRSSPVFSGSRMIIRGQKYLWCIGR
jgi:outer membrane protein assembly factor BamB